MFIPFKCTYFCSFSYAVNSTNQAWYRTVTGWHGTRNSDCGR